MVNRQMNLIWETAEAEGKYWALSDVEYPCNFRPVAMDNCPPNLRPLQQDFNIVAWVLNEYLPRLLTMQVVWEVIIGELLWKVLKTKLCINRCCKFWNGARGKNKVKELVPSYSWLMSSSLCKQRSCCYSSQVSSSEQSFWVSWLDWYSWTSHFPICKMDWTVGLSLWQQDLHVQDQIVRNLNIRMIPATAQ